MIESGRETLSSSEGHTTAPVGSVGWVVMVQVINNSHIKELKNCAKYSVAIVFS